MQGILGPHVETREEAQRLVDAYLLPPEGTRGWGLGRGTTFNDVVYLARAHASNLDYGRWANTQMLVTAQDEEGIR